AALSFLAMLDVVDIFGAVEVDDQMHAGAAHALADGKMVLTIIVGDWLDDRDLGNLLVSLSGGAWKSQALIRSQEGVLAHRRPPQPVIQPECHDGALRKANAAHTAHMKD